MKVRIGVSLGPAGGPGQFAAAVDLLEQERVDSLWLPENVYSPSVEPFTGMAFALARTRRLKAGSGISVLPVFGLQPAQPAERPLFPVPDKQRAAVFDESLTLLRLLLTSESVTFHGEFFTVEDASIGPLPAKPLDIWLGGSAPGGLRRVGRLADGWLGSLLTPAEAREAVATINQAATDAGRHVDDDHFGLSIPVALDGDIPDAQIAAIRRRRPGTDPRLLVAAGWDGARRMIEQYVEAGLSKFVVRPAARFEPFGEFIDGFVRELKPLQN
jgi:probable F420-dependent oxidoreductase